MATNTDFLNAGALVFMQRYPLIAAGGDTTVQSGHGAFYKVPKASRVQFMEIHPGTHYSLANIPLLAPTGGIPNREGDPQQARLFAANNPAGNRIPVFWLPYRQNEMYRMTLDPAGATQPNFFLTDAVDGCSVYVEGTRTRPTVHHVNAAGTKYTPPDGSAPFGTTGDFAKDTLAFQAKDQHMTQQVIGGRKPKDVLNAVAGVQPGKYVKNDDYMTRRPEKLAHQGTLINTAARSVVTNVSVDKVDPMTQGTVFGIRDAVSGNWTFYFQRRLVLVLYHLNNYWGRWDPRVWENDYSVVGYRMYPVKVREFWPGGKGHLFVRP